MKVKDGITLDDGTPLDGAAVKYNIDASRFSPLTGPAFLGLSDGAAEGRPGSDAAIRALWQVAERETAVRVDVGDTATSPSNSPVAPVMDKVLWIVDGHGVRLCRDLPLEARR